MAIMEISVVPLGLGQTSVGDYIAAVVQYLQKEQVPHYLTDMGTIVEGSIEQLLQVAQALHELPFNRGVKRVLTHLTIDDRRDKEVHLDDKIRAVKQRLV
ncbi:MAG: MTH1187 family thiamine-binding protein [Deltaproteobacteria bacterium]|nr:MTH1187 family thiamine-binding protein [Deltaproteobacteria bacterium]MBW1951837.1 MTH1187 family thiamine-binding protein [Deltaproteobacteria bacterium]MBW1986582.1 MTH1187 family thiamine-binding protein [Deltaproteobacteria bacterium]MBW2133740.1 MTH1187 family thiamine-binding protein [Deltaproteobacteria bacterium]